MPKVLAEKYMNLNIYRHTLKSGKVYYTFTGGAKYGYPTLKDAQNAVYWRKLKNKGKRRR